MLRVTVVDSTDMTVRLRVEGRLTGRCVEELRQSCDLHALAEGMSLTLDLADVSFADADGVELLKVLKKRDVAIVNLMPFLVLQLCDPTGGNLKLGINGDGSEGG